MITFLKHLWFTLKFNKAKALVREECGEVKELNGVYYAVLTNGLVYDIRHFNKFFNVRIFYKGICISTFKYSSDAKLLSRKEQGLINGEAILARMNIKTTLSQILCDCPFTRCAPESFLRLAESLSSQYTSDDLLSFFFEKHYTSISMVDYKLTLRGVNHQAYSSKYITVIDGVVYEKIKSDYIPKKSLQNIHFLDTNCDLLRPFFIEKEDKFCLVYFDLKCMHMVHFIEEYKLERNSINYHNGSKTTHIEQSTYKTVHQYLENIIYELIKIKASEQFIEHCSQCGISIEDTSHISDDEMELFKMAIY
jgi:hypothetical protein